MPSTEDLLQMYSTAKSVLHLQIANDLSRRIGDDFVGERSLRDGNISAVGYLQGKYVSDLADKADTLRMLYDADIGQSSSDFQRNFWVGLIDYINAGRLLVELDVSPFEINPLKVVERKGFVDIIFDFRL